MSDHEKTDPLWSDRVSEYLEELEQGVAKLDQALVNMRGGTMQLEMGQLHQSHEQLSRALVDMETLIAARESLLNAADAPSVGGSIREILDSQDDPFFQLLSKRCQQVASRIDASRERALAMFVCQFQLSDLSSTLLSLVSGMPNREGTYGYGSDLRRPVDRGGSILNKSA